jgi:hypothetical protein
MMIIRYTLIIGLITLFWSVGGCKKVENENKDQTPQGTKVTYNMDTVLNTLVLITYNDENGNKVEITDWQKFSGSKTIYVTKKPFNALLRTVSDNPGNTPLYHLLYITVNDSIKAYKSYGIPPSSSGYTQEVTYTVQ